MRAIHYEQGGGIDHIAVVELPRPEALPGQVLVRVRASCINPGSLAALNGAPFKPIRDLAGELIGLIWKWP